MRLLWLCNNAPGVIRAHQNHTPVEAVNWVDQVLEGLRKQGLCLHVLFRGTPGAGALDDGCTYLGFDEPLPQKYYPELEALFRQELRRFQPDVIHSWGLEYGHTLALVNAARQEGMLSRMCASIQGLCHYIACHYNEGIPCAEQHRGTFRDVVRRDNLVQQQEKFRQRGRMEAQAMAQLHHVVGRTHWDRACALELNPQIQYHSCNETLRPAFYQGTWDYAGCRRHRIFASSCDYPVKGFHYLLEAAAQVREAYPDITLAVPGEDFLHLTPKEKLRQGSYGRYLARLAKAYHLENNIEFLGHLTQEQMKAEYLKANVFCLSSTIENSPNALGEAMLLGVPCIAANVGGVGSLLEDGTEGRLYQSTAPYLLGHHIRQVFAMEDGAQALGRAAQAHARKTHNSEANLARLLEIYQQIGEERHGTET